MKIFNSAWVKMAKNSKWVLEEIDFLEEILRQLDDCHLSETKKELSKLLEIISNLANKFGQINTNGKIFDKNEWKICEEILNSERFWRKSWLLLQLEQWQMAIQNIIFAIMAIFADDRIVNIENFSQILAKELEEFSFAMWQKMAPKILPKSCSLLYNFPPKLENDEKLSILFPWQVECEAACRIDLAGGWTDTPPITYQLDLPLIPTVLTMAISVNQKKPIRCSITHLSSIFAGVYIQLISPTNLNSKIIHFSKAKDIFENSNKPFKAGSLICAILVAGNFVKKSQNFGINEQKFWFEFGGNSSVKGLFIKCVSDLPHGSGLGTSSILSGAILSSLWKLRGLKFTDSDLIETVLKIEQLHGSGGGWQDQMGGCTKNGGLKLGTVIGEQVRWTPVKISSKLKKQIENQLVLIYTGRTRLAKNLLQQVVLKWLRNESEIKNVVERLSEGAKKSADILHNKDEFPLEICEEYTDLKSKFASNTETLVISRLRKALKDSGLALGSWISGAGGGGFLYVWMPNDKNLIHLNEFLGSDSEWSEMTASNVHIDYEPLKFYCKY